MLKAPSTAQQITTWVKKTIQKAPENLRIQRKHIEQDRKWRNILFADVMAVLKSGQATQTRPSDQSVIWRGTDEQGRSLELLCSMESMDGADTLVVKEARTFRVGTAYDPNEDDGKLRQEWLIAHPEYELTPDGKRVQRKLSKH